MLDIGPDYTTTDHTESESGQEELYLVLRGAATMLVGPEGAEERVELAPGEVVARVAPEARRLFQTGSEGARLLIVGGTPGRPTRRRTGRAAASDRRGPAQRPLCSTAARKRAASTA